MTSATARLKRADKLVAKFYPPRGPLQWIVCQEAGEEIPEEIARHFQKGDAILLTEHPAFYLGEDVPMRYVATSFPLYGSGRDMRHSRTIVVERPRERTPQGIEDVGFARRTTQRRV